MNIKNKNLLINKCYVNGAWVSSDKKIKVINPATGELIAEVPNFGKKETINAIDSAELAFKSWSKFTAHERSKILKKWYSFRALYICGWHFAFLSCRRNGFF